MGSFSYDGNDMSIYNVTVVDWAIDAMPAAQLDVQTVPQGPGAMQSASHGPRTINITYAIKGNTYLDLWENQDHVNRILDVRNGPKNLAIDDITDRYWVSGLTSPIPMVPRGISNYTEMSITFLSVEPGYSNVETDQTFAIASDPDTFTVDTDVAVKGSEPAVPLWLIRNETGGAVTSVTLANTTLSETIQWAGSLTDDYWLAFATGDNTALSMESSTIYISTSAGSDPLVLSYTASMGGMHATNNKFPRLKPNVQNSMTVTGVSTGTAQWVYRARFI